MSPDHRQPEAKEPNPVPQTQPIPPKQVKPDLWRQDRPPHEGGRPQTHYPAITHVTARIFLLTRELRFKNDEETIMWPLCKAEPKCSLRSLKALLAQGPCHVIAFSIKAELLSQLEDSSGTHGWQQDTAFPTFHLRVAVYLASRGQGSLIFRDLCCVWATGFGLLPPADDDPVVLFISKFILSLPPSF
ncbi:hypothetical protein ACOSQ3_016513 [Xanthoceras sorbifolium]